MKQRTQSGFSTLEVIAAIAIIAIALVPIISLQTQIARTQAHLAETHARSTDISNALALLRDVNPMLEPNGRRDLGGARALTWTATPLSPLRESRNPIGFEVRLYRVSAEVRDGSDTSTFQIELIGWRRVNAN